MSEQKLMVALILIAFFFGHTCHGYFPRLYHSDSEKRNVEYRDWNIPVTNQTFDVIRLENFHRSYLDHDSQIDDNPAMFYNQDVIAAHVGPRPFSDKGELVRGWAMFDRKTLKHCNLVTIYNWGEVALFTCPEGGVYRAYAMEYPKATNALPGKPIDLVDGGKSEVWIKRVERISFDILFGRGTYGETVDDLFKASQCIGGVNKDCDRFERMSQVIKWDTQPGNQSAGSHSAHVVTSDPVTVKKAHNCYYWKFLLTKVSQDGFVGRHPITVANASSFMKFQVDIWIAEPSAVGVYETFNHQIQRIVVSDYSKVITNRFYKIGLTPCIKRASRVIEIVKKMEFIPGNRESNALKSTPHWRCFIKVHADRVISRTSDVKFVIASRQNSGLFNCFVGETRVFISLRRFEFVPQGELNDQMVNLEVSNILDFVPSKLTFELDHVLGHGTHFVGHKNVKRYAPASRRTDMIIRINPCVSLELAFAVTGSLYFVDDLLRGNEMNIQEVVIPYFPLEKNQNVRPGLEGAMFLGRHLNVRDVTFTPTHAALLMDNGHVFLQTSFAAVKGVADVKSMRKYRADAFVRRRWCPRTTTPKMSSMMIPAFTIQGSIVILQIYPTEDTMNIWNQDPEFTCLAEEIGFVSRERKNTVNESLIHCHNQPNRTNERTGSTEPPGTNDCGPPRSYDMYDFSEMQKFMKDSNGSLVKEDPHFPPNMVNPASYSISPNLTAYNEAVVYDIETGPSGKNGLMKKLLSHGLSVPGGDQEPLVAVEFTAREKEYLYALVFNAAEIPLAEVEENGTLKFHAPFQMVISTLIIPSYPTAVRLRYSDTDEKLVSDTSFPGTIIVRSKAFDVPVVESQDDDERKVVTTNLKGLTAVRFSPEVFPMDTSITSYVVNFGDVIIMSSIENRYARPLSYFPWAIIDDLCHLPKLGLDNHEEYLHVDDNSTTNFRRNERPYDLVVTSTGALSVLWRKEHRHYIMDDEVCLRTNDTLDQGTALGSAFSLEGLREVRMFFRHDNAFHMATHDGRILYGIYNVRGASNFMSCAGNWTETQNDTEACVDQPELIEQFDTTANKTVPAPIPGCTKDLQQFAKPCRDPRFIEACPGPIDRQSLDISVRNLVCMRMNSGCYNVSSRGSSSGSLGVYGPDLYPRVDPGPTPAPGEHRVPHCQNISFNMLPCNPPNTPKEEIRTMRLLGSGLYRSYLEGSLDSVKVTHPEALVEWTEFHEELPICPFASFELHYEPFDFAEVGYQTRITAQLSYYGTGIPSEADLLVEYEQTIGVIVEVGTHVDEERDLTTIFKTVDISFALTDWLLVQMQNTKDGEKMRLWEEQLTFEHLRAREPFRVFSVTFRPTLANLRCVEQEWFKTIHFNVGCNSASTMRLVAEETVLTRMDASKRAEKNWKRGDKFVTVPKKEVHKKQSNIEKGEPPILQCEEVNKEFFCKVPYFHLFKSSHAANDDIFNIHYRDELEPIFEQFLTKSSRIVTGNVVIYDMMGQDVGENTFELTLNKMDAGCHNTENFWYKRLLARTKEIGKEAFEHENVYIYYKDCFSTNKTEGDRENSQNLYVSPFYLFNKTNQNRIRFQRKRNRIFVFRAAVVNTKFNRFTYCKYLDTYFMVRVTGVPKSREGLLWYLYLLIALAVFLAVFISYLCFRKWFRGAPTTVHHTHTVTTRITRY